MPLSQWSLIESKSDKRPHRVDHTLTWQQNQALDSGSTGGSSATAGAHERMEVQILGDEVANYRAYVKIPDDWRRQREELTLPRVMLSMVLPFLVLGGLMVTAVIIFLKNLRSEDAHAIPWRRIGGWGLWGLAGYIIIFAFGNRLASFLNAYQTAIPFKTMLVGIGIGAVLGGVVYFAGIVLLFGMAWFFARRAFGEGRLPGWSGMPPAYYRDALWIGVGGTAALVGISRVAALVATHWPTAHRAMEASFGSDFDAMLPVASMLGTTLLRGLMYTGLVALAASFVAAYVRQTWLRAVLFVCAALALVGSNWGSPADLARQFVVEGLVLVVLVLGVMRVVRFNMLGYFLIAALTALLAGGSKLVAQPDAFYKVNGYAAFLLLAALLAWPLAAWRERTWRSLNLNPRPHSQNECRGSALGRASWGRLNDGPAANLKSNDGPAVLSEQIKGNKVGAESVVIKGSDAHLRRKPVQQGGHAGVRAVFRAGLMKTTGLLCGGARHGTGCSFARSSAREQKAKNVASTMGFGCGR